jgi:hypothetical protein
VNWVRAKELWRERARTREQLPDPRQQIEAAIEWLAAAQDASTDDRRTKDPEDRGVSHSYLIGERWMRSYPETTGYIIPTLLNWSRQSGHEQSVRRALEMAQWELTIQLPDGAIPDLTTGEPVVFDTGQVMFGWIAAYEYSGQERYLDAARRAAAWLMRVVDADGVWRHPGDAGGPGRVYNARVGWAMLELARIDDDDRIRSQVRRFLDWGLTKESSPGWYECNCLTDDDGPLLHTIAYTARGQLECGLLLGESRYVEASRRTAEKVAALVPADGRLPGRFDRQWRPTVSWVCLTGLAQMSILWRKHATLGDRQGPNPSSPNSVRLLAASECVNSFLRRTQDLRSSNPGLRGGIRGSFPVNGAYGRWRVLNWATKFFVDALMIEQDADALHHRG